MGFGAAGVGFVAVPPAAVWGWSGVAGPGAGGVWGGVCILRIMMRMFVMRMVSGIENLD